MVYQFLRLPHFMHYLCFSGLLLTGCALASQQETNKRNLQENLCADLAKITELPMKDDMPVNDPIYLAIRQKGKAAIGCLIDHVTDETPMKDPRSAPSGPSQFKVGDLAFFLLIRTGVTSFDEVLPPEARPSTSTLGIASYFLWVEKPGNRALLKRNCLKIIKIQKAMSS